jgi:hypothetical protein
MTSPLRHIAIWGLAGMLLFGQTGMSLHQIYCFCKGQWEASLFAVADDDCDMHDDVAELPACCQGAEASCHMGDSQPCKEDVVVYVQLDAQATPATEDNWAQAATHWLAAPVFPGFTFFFPSTPAPQRPLADPDPPSLRDGRSIRTWVQSFLC